MIVASILLVFFVAVRIGFGYVEAFAPALPWFTRICIAFGVLLGILIVIKIYQEIRKK